LPGISGPELQQELSLREIRIPIVFITANEDQAIRPHLLAQGAVECLFKPFSDTALLAAVNSASGDLRHVCNAAPWAMYIRV
jgi:FixJ family two-component response regulator